MPEQRVNLHPTVYVVNMETCKLINDQLRLRKYTEAKKHVRINRSWQNRLSPGKHKQLLPVRNYISKFPLSCTEKQTLNQHREAKTRYESECKTTTTKQYLTILKKNKTIFRVSLVLFRKLAPMFKKKGSGKLWWVNLKQMRQSLLLNIFCLISFTFHCKQLFPRTLSKQRRLNYLFMRNKQLVISYCYLICN